MVWLALASFGCDEPRELDEPGLARGELSLARGELSRIERQQPELFVTPRERPARALRATLPALADGAVELGDVARELSARIERIGAQPSSATVAAQWHVYPDGAGPGSAVLLRATPAGYEERIAFDRAPTAAEVRYRIELSDSLPGLRQVAGVLELLDAAGAPRLRLGPPLLLGADGQPALPRLAVEGCAVERDPAAPWGRAPRAAGAEGCELSVSWETIDVAYPAVLAQSWSTTTDLAIARERFALATLASGVVLVAGGVSTSGEALASAELYDATTGTWAMTTSMAEPRSEHSLSLLGSGRALVAGGRIGARWLDGCELYDPGSGRWLSAPPLPAPRAGHAATTLDGGDVLLAGGEGSSEALRFSGAWSSAGELLAVEPGATLTALSGGRALLVGPEPPAAQVYDSSTGRWSEVPPPAVARSGHSATRLSNGRVLIAGGRTRDLRGNEVATRAAEVFEATTSSWQSVGATRDAHVLHTATRLPSGRVLVVGGEGGQGSELYDPAWGTWVPGPELAAPRAQHGAALLADGTLLIVGGSTLAVDTDAVETADAEPSLPDAGGSAEMAATEARALRAADATAAASAEGRVLASVERLDTTPAAPVTSEYKLPARLDRGVTSAAVTELWASVTRPSRLEEGRRYPVIMALAGNHATCGTGSNPREDSDCSYTHTGRCPDGFSVVASHRGFDYIASELAARGYIVVSVNANRGINCGDGDGDDWSMNLARGRLLLRHLERLGQYNRGEQRTPSSLGVSLAGKLDFSQVGLLGHSRGGEGARAAYQQYRDADSPWPARLVDPLVIRGIFEIAPVDGQTPRRLDPDGVAWTALLPMCDGDVSDLQGARPFDRMLRLSDESPPALKATLTAWGTNHNFFNTQWQASDSTGCAGHRALFGAVQGSAEQRQIALGAVLDFFRASVGDAAARRPAERLDPAVRWPSQTRVDRGYVPGVGPEQGLLLEDFRARSGVGMRGLGHLSRGLRLVHSGVPEHDPSARAALLRWDPGEPGARFFELHFAESGQGLDLSGFDYLDFRVDRASSIDNPNEPTRLAVQLLGADDTLSPALDVGAFGVILDGPVGGPRDNAHSMLQTARLPLVDFGEGRARSVRGVRFNLPDTSGGALFLADVRATLGSERSTSEGALVARAPELDRQAQRQQLALATPLALPLLAGAELESRPPEQLVRAGNALHALSSSGSDVEVELATPERFVVQDDALVLEIGGQRVYRSRHPDGDLRRVIFSVDSASFSRARDGAELRVRSSSSGAKVWEFGALNKARLRR